MGSVELLVMAGEGGSPRRFLVERDCWNKFMLISCDAAGGSESGPGS